MQVLPSSDVETLVIGYLTDRLDVPVADTRGETQRCVRVNLVAFTRTAHVIDVATVALQAYDPDPEAARRLCREAHDELIAAVGYFAPDGAYVRDVQTVSLPVPFPDPDARLPRYQASVDINVTPSEEQQP